MTVGGRQITRFQPLATEFWTVIAPQLSHIYISIRHSLIALGVFQESARVSEFRERLRGMDPYFTALKHYNKSIRAFVEKYDEMSLTAKLSCCLLFTAQSIYLDNKGVAEVHTLAARDLIRNYERAASNSLSSRDKVIEQLYKPIFTRLMMDCYTFSDNISTTDAAHVLIDQAENNLYNVVTKKCPASIENPSHAYELANTLMNHAIGLFLQASPVSAEMAGNTLNGFRHFSFFLQDKIYKLKTEGLEYSYAQSSVHRACKLLLVHCRVATVMATHAMSNHDETSFDNHIADFKYILSRCSEILISDENFGRDIWDTTFGILPPLFFVATRCRDRTMRLQALGFLHRSSRVERAWSSCMAYLLAKFVIQEEENSRHPSVSVPSPSPPPHFPSYVAPATRVRITHVQFMRLSERVLIEHVQGRWKNSTRPLPVTQTLLPYIPCPELRKSSDTAISRKVIQAAGYFGVFFLSPPIRCHCASAA